jgi:hypothetical protein
MRAGAVIASGHPGTESGGVLALAYRDVLARSATLIVAALDGANPKLEGSIGRASSGQQNVTRVLP